MNGEYAKETLASLEGLDAEELKRRYSELFGSGIDASRFGRAFLRRRIAAKLQEAVYGDALTAAEMSTIEFVASKDWMCNAGEGKPKPSKARPTRNVSFTKVYKGRTYTMTTDALGRFIYEGKPYRSPTAVARAITGSLVNGRVWWGIK